MLVTIKEVCISSIDISNVNCFNDPGSFLEGESAFNTVRHLSHQQHYEFFFFRRSESLSQQKGQKNPALK